MGYNPQLVGHLGFGSYFVYLGVCAFLEAAEIKGLKTRHYDVLHFIGSFIFGPFAIMLEFFLTKHHLNMENLHHYNLYSLAVLDALLVLMCDLQRILPKKWRIAYETLLFVCAGVLFTAHNSGNILFNGFHQVMLPGLAIVAIIHYICELDPSQQTLKLLRCLLLSIFGTWFINIALGFFWFPGKPHGGYLGTISDEIDPHMAYGTLSYIFSLHFIGWVLFYTIILTILTVGNLRESDRDITDYKLLQTKDIDIDDDYSNNNNIQLGTMKHNKTFV